MISAKLSYWEKESFFKDIDVAIIGSGIVGLNAAIRLKEKNPHLRVLVIERGALPIGASTRNAGFACFGSLSELLEDLKNHSVEEVLALVEQRWKGLQHLRETIGDKGLGYQELGGYEVFRETDEPLYEACLDQLSFFNTQFQSIIGRNNIYEKADERIDYFGFNGVEHLIWNQAEGQIHTGKMMKALLDLATAKGIQIVNGLSISKMEDSANGVFLQTENGWDFKAQKLLIATNGFAQNLLPALDVEPARNQVLITHPIPGLQLKGCFHYDGGYFYFRNIDNRILLGGGRHLAMHVEATTEFGTTSEIQKALVNLLQNVICPQQEVLIDSWWSGILGVGAQKKPLVKQVSERVVIAVRMGGMGVAIGSLIGREGADLMAV